MNEIKDRKHAVLNIIGIAQAIPNIANCRNEYEIHLLRQSCKGILALVDFIEKEDKNNGNEGTEER